MLGGRSNPFKTPILFALFKDPETTLKVFDAIRKEKPQKLYISADGPRLDVPGEREECELTRSILSKIDWTCDVKTKFSDVNLGIKKGTSSAISWFFENEDEGIILEHDDLPTRSFFPFCETLLERHRENKRIMHIGGSNLMFGQNCGNGSYYYSRIAQTWGFATWKDRWKLWDGEIKDFPDFRDGNYINNYFFSTFAKEFWNDKFQEIYEGHNSTTWAFPWIFALMIRDAVSITPNVNLVSNIGFNPKAVHSRDLKHKYNNVPRHEMEELIDPPFIIPDVTADEFMVRDMAWEPFPRILRKKVRKHLKKTLPDTTYQTLKKMIKI